jgi:hypothetical protein
METVGAQQGPSGYNHLIGSPRFLEDLSLSPSCDYFLSLKYLLDTRCSFLLSSSYYIQIASIATKLQHRKSSYVLQLSELVPEIMGRSASILNEYTCTNSTHTLTVGFFLLSLLFLITDGRKLVLVDFLSFY